MASIKERLAKDGTKRYTVDIRLKGQHSQRATFKRLTDAKKYVQDTESAIREGRYFKTTQARKHTFSDLIDRYNAEVLPFKPKQAAKQKMQLEWWREKLGVYVLADITPALIVQYRNELLSGITYRHTQRSPATVVRYMAALSHAYSIAVNEWQWIEDTPDIPHLSKAIFDLKCSPLKFTKGFDYKNLQQLQLGSSRLNSRNG